MRRDIEHNLKNILAILLVVCRLLPSNHLTPKEKPSSFVLLMG
jgi:hypothetical protein